ncbi:MAG TPA: NAD-dependent epimerase/dehydratase family protein [Myxococcota bacterium]|jgi:uncharacterized protein YbjT (DUF2867 family)
MKVILTGATGMVGEGVLLECLDNPQVERVLVVSRKPCGIAHQKMSELVVDDFLRLEPRAELAGYDACFYCAGISSVGMSEADYTRITYDTVTHFAEVIVALNPGMTMCHVSGRSTDSTEQGKVMWARIKGRAENALMKMPFRAVYNFRPAFMQPTPGQRRVKPALRVGIVVLGPIFRALAPGSASTLKGVARAMIKCVAVGAPKNILEVADINALAA